MIKGSKVALGALMAPDSDLLLRWLNDPEAARMDLPFRPTDWVSFRNWLESVGRDQSRVWFAIRKLNEAPIIGFTALNAINLIHRTADLAIRIGDEENRGRGYGTEALLLMLDFAWRHLNLDRVALVTVAGNERALGAFKAAGFEHEGVARSAAFIDGRRRDMVMMAALRPAVELVR